ncbi:MAG: peptidase [Alkalispirochaetaceae bacterium]
MSFCLGIKVADGLVALADTRITTGSERITARKLNTYAEGSGRFFVMTSGLRSVRDKVLTYFEEERANQTTTSDRLFKVVNRFAALIRRVATEDKAHLAADGLSFNSHVLIGGQLSEDSEHKLYLIYPPGNWIEVGDSSPYQIIGTTSYGKPVIDRVLTYDDTIEVALKVGVLSFDSTRISAADVGFPIDVALYRRNTFTLVEHRYELEELTEITSWWQDRLRSTLAELPDSWIGSLLSQLPPSPAPSPGRAPRATDSSP